MATALRRCLEVLLAAILLLAGLAALLAAFGFVSARLYPPEDPRKLEALRFGLEMAFIVISLKGLLPQLLIASLVRPLLARAAGPGREGPWVEAVVLFAAATLAYAVVGPLLLTREALGLPALRHTNAVQHLGTLLSTSAGVAAAFWTARFALRRRPQEPPAQFQIG